MEALRPGPKTQDKNDILKIAMATKNKKQDRKNDKMLIKKLKNDHKMPKNKFEHHHLNPRHAIEFWLGNIDPDN